MGSDYADGADSAQIADYADSLLYTRFREFNLVTLERDIRSHFKNRKLVMLSEAEACFLYICHPSTGLRPYV